MSAPAMLTADLRQQVLALTDDLRNRVEPDPGSTVQPQDGVLQAWKEEYRQAVTAERTAATWTTWRDERVTRRRWRGCW